MNALSVEFVHLFWIPSSYFRTHSTFSLFSLLPLLPLNPSTNPVYFSSLINVLFFLLQARTTNVENKLA